MACGWRLLANLRAGRGMGYGVWLVAVGELKGRPGTGIWDMGYETIGMLAGIRTRDLRFRSPAP